MQKSVIKVRYSLCNNIENAYINELYGCRDSVLQHALEKNCLKCRKLLAVYMTTYIEEDNNS